MVSRTNENALSFIMSIDQRLGGVGSRRRPYFRSQRKGRQRARAGMSCSNENWVRLAEAGCGDASAVSHAHKGTIQHLGRTP